MSKKKKTARPKARLPKGLRDVAARELRAMGRMLGIVQEVYESWGFEPLDTPAFEYTDALGKFLPDRDRPNAGVFSFLDDDGQWLSLRYDLTAPLARHVAEHYDALPKPFRRCQWGPVWRNEKPGPGRYREFIQFDADTVGAASLAADAELCMMTADCLERLGIERGQYVVRVNNRKILDGVLVSIGADPDDADFKTMRLAVLRAIDKLDRLGKDAVRDLLGAGRKDVSGDYTRGAGLDSTQAGTVMAFVEAGGGARNEVLARLKSVVANNDLGRQGLDELAAMSGLFDAGGYGQDRIVLDPTIVRGLEYYTGPVFEAELTFDTSGDGGKPVRFGSIGGGGRYDGLVARFKGTEIPATGFSIGVSRLYAALDHLGKLPDEGQIAPVVVLAMDAERMGEYQQMAGELRAAGIRAEVYMGTSAMRAQMKYADRRGAPCVIIEGEDERARGEVTIKDLAEGARLSREIEDNAQWREGRPAQVSVARKDLLASVRDILARPRS